MSKETKITEKEIDEIAVKTGKEANKEAKVRIRIPLDKLNPKDLVVPVVINGYVWQINRGEAVEVPQTVADILAEAGYI